MHLIVIDGTPHRGVSRAWNYRSDMAEKMSPGGKIAGGRRPSMDASKPVEGACHCGAVRFTVTLAEGLEQPRRCNCSMCRMRGAVVVSAMLDDLTVTHGRDMLRLYQFNTKKAEHYFCSVCGIYTHHRRRSNPNHFSINVACLAGVSPFDFECVPVYDGVTHPNDRPAGAGDGIAGHLRYEKAMP
jgi:hypothetical protein